MLCFTCTKKNPLRHSSSFFFRESKDDKLRSLQGLETTADLNFNETIVLKKGKKTERIVNEFKKEVFNIQKYTTPFLCPYEEIVYSPETGILNLKIYNPHTNISIWKEKKQKFNIRKFCKQFLKIAKFFQKRNLNLDYFTINTMHMDKKGNLHLSHYFLSLLQKCFLKNSKFEFKLKNTQEQYYRIVQYLLLQQNIPIQKTEYLNDFINKLRIQAQNQVWNFDLLNHSFLNQEEKQNCNIQIQQISQDTQRTMKKVHSMQNLDRFNFRKKQQLSKNDQQKICFSIAEINNKFNLNTQKLKQSISKINRTFEMDFGKTKEAFYKTYRTAINIIDKKDSLNFNSGSSVFKI